MKPYLVACVLAVPVFASVAAPAPCPIQLKDVTRQTGISFVHTDGSSGQRYIVETVASGLALFDYDNDGDVDIYFLNGAPLRGTPSPTDPPRNALWRNEGNWRFTDVTRSSGLGDTGYALAVATADYDNDGDQDVYISNFGPNVLYRNNGNGTFSDVTAAAGVVDGVHKVGAGVAFIDIDRDGDLDLLSTHYIDFAYTNHTPVRFNGHPAYAGPLNYRPVPFTLFRNEGNGKFTDISVQSGIAAHKGAGMGLVCGDFDNDGDSDIFVCNDKTGNFLFLNDGHGKFQEMAGLAGVGFDGGGRAMGSMGAEAADVDNDGWLDIYQTSYQQELATLFRNVGQGFFEDITRQSGAGDGTLRFVKWGVGIVDFDNDTHRDLFVACGHLHDNVELFDNTTSYECPKVLLRNSGGLKFSNVSEIAGDGLKIRRSARGAGFDDLDNDGDIDVVILNSRKEPTLLRNDSVRTNHWLQLQLRGTRSNRDAIGARVRVTCANQTFIDEVRSGRGYQGDYGRRLHFGLGAHRKVDRVEVLWPSGQKSTAVGIPANTAQTLTEPP